MNKFLSAFILFFLNQNLFGFFIPLSVEEKVAQADFVGVIEIKKGSFDEGSWEALILESIKGNMKGEKIEITTYTLIEGEIVYSIGGADPYLEKNKKYLVYLKESEDHTFQVVQSGFDALEIKEGFGGPTVENEVGNKRIYLRAKMNTLRNLIQNQNKAMERNFE